MLHKTPQSEVAVASPGMEPGVGWRQSLSARLLLLTMLFVMGSVALIYFPSMARYHRQLLDDRVRLAELAILPFTEVSREQVSEALRRELLLRANVSAVIVRGQGQHELFLLGSEPPVISAVYNVNANDLFAEIADLVRTLNAPPGRTIRIDATTMVGPQKPGQKQTIEVVGPENPIRNALFAFSRQMLGLALFISVIVSGLVFLALYRLVVRPVARITRAMAEFRDDPENNARILVPSQRGDEIGIAERELARLQNELNRFLHHKKRLAALGESVSKIQHDLRNILSSAQLASDRLSAMDDPKIRHQTDRLVAALGRAVHLATETLKYGGAEEAPPVKRSFALAPLARDVAESAAPEGCGIVCTLSIPDGLMVQADPEQLFRVLLNLTKNARQALESAGGRGVVPAIAIEAKRDGDGVVIDVTDNGPGIPDAVRSRLFQPFAGSLSGGSGLGLAIARELIEAHGGEMTLVSTGPEGTHFRVTLPDAPAA